MKPRSFAILIVILLITAVYSYFNHENLYRFYMKNYYEISGKSSNYMEKSKKLFLDGKYKELENFAEILMFIYPENYKLKQVAGLNYIKLGREIEGAELFASALQGGVDESGEIPHVIRILFRNDHFGDILSFYDRGVMKNDVNIAFYYGGALYHAGRFEESLERLEYARSHGFAGSEINYYIALNMEQKGNISSAAAYMEAAYRQNRRDREIKMSLIRIYRKAGRLQEAETLFRGM